MPKKCCARCKTPYNCASKACNCHRDTRSEAAIQRDKMLAIFAEAEALTPKPAPANVIPLFQEPTP